MKNLITSTILVLALLLSATATAHDFKVDGIYYKINDNEAAVTFRGQYYYSFSNEYSGSVVIPATVTYDGTTYPVTSIGDEAFNSCSGLTSIDLPNSITEINDYAFAYCSGLTSIVIPNSVTKIGRNAFLSCTGLASIDIPKSVTEIGRYAFDYTPWFNNQPDGLLYAGKVAYKYKGTMPSGTSITLRNGTTSITGSAFAYCSGLTSIVIPNSVTDIGPGAFAHCSDLTSVNIPDSVTVIRGGTFRGCSGLTSIVIPNLVDSIAGEAFTWTGLTSIVIPNSVTEIDHKAFDCCSGLTSIVVESGNPRYDSPNDCNAIIETASNTLIVGCENTIIPNSITEIGDYAFSARTGLTSIVIPNSVTAIGFSAFAYCSGLTSIDIPNSVTSIGILAFNKCTGLSSIVIPNSVTEIGDHAFSSCKGVTSIVIPNSVTAIGYEAFSSCSGLSDVYCYIADLSRVSSGLNDPCYWWYLYDHRDYSGRTLHVLQGMTGAYQADKRWFPYFGQIVDDIIMGDANRDLEVNIADVNAVINLILEGNDDIAADVNGDGEINIADINAVIDIILSTTRN